MSSCSRFFHCCSFSILLKLSLLIFSSPQQNFHVVLSAKFVSLVFRLPRSLFLCYPCQCRFCGSILSLERLPFVWKTRKFRGELEWSGSSRVKFSGKKVIPFEVLPFFRFYRNNRNFVYHLFGLLVSGFMSRESEKFIGTSQSRSCFR